MLQNLQQSQLITLYHHLLQTHWFYSCYSDTCFNTLQRYYDTCTVIVAEAELLSYEAEDLVKEGMPTPRSMTTTHRQLQDQLLKIQLHIDTTRSCLADTCQQLGVAISEYINEE